VSVMHDARTHEKCAHILTHTHTHTHTHMHTGGPVGVLHNPSRVVAAVAGVTRDALLRYDS
jgi:hypothetical protein